MYFRKVVCFCAVLVFGFNAAVTLAEDAPPSGLIVTVFQVKPGLAQQFEAGATKFKAAADKVGSPEYAAYSPGIGSSGQYAIVRPFASYQEFAVQQNVMAEVYKGEELAKLGQSFQESVASIDSYVIVPRPDLGVAPPDFESPPEILLLVSVTVKSGMDAQFVEYLENLVEATKATSPETYYLAFQPGIGSGPIWRFGIPMNWADLDSPDKPIPQRMMEHFGKRGGEKAFQAGQDAIEGIEFAVSRIRTDLSHNN